MSKSITVRDFAGIREINLRPSGNLVVIAGKNGAGKSSLLNAVAEIFNSKGVKLYPKPIREGADEAYAEYVDEELGLRFSRTWKKDDAGKLEVTALDGARYSKPSEVIASLTGGLLFDPLEFLQMDEKRQRDALLAKVDLPFDLDELARERAGAETRRLDAGRDVRRLQGALDSMAKPVADVPAEELSGAEVLAELDAARVHNESIRRYGNAAIEVERHIEGIDKEMARLQDQMDELRRERITQEQRATEFQQKAELLKPIDEAPLQAKLAAVDETNAAVRAAKERHRVQDALAEAVTQQEDAQADLDAIDVRKREALAAATFPVDGLSVDETGVTFQGIPFGQVNTAMRRKVAFAIATAGEPKLRLVIVKDGDLLDAESLEGIRDLAARRGYTVLVERDRDESRDIGFTIVDGALAGAGVAK